MAQVTGDPQHDFFDQNPEIRYVSEFKLLIQDEGPEKASKLMWCAYMMGDPKSKIFQMPEEEKILEIQNNYYSEFNPKESKELIRFYGRFCMDKEEFMYSIHMAKLDELTEGLNNLSIEKDEDFSKYIRIMDKLPKIWDGLDKVKAKMISKQNKTALRGGAARSSREKRMSS